MDTDIASLLGELKETRKTLDGMASRKRVEDIEKSINELFAKIGRPGGEGFGAGEALERKDAIDWCLQRKALTVPKNDGMQAAAYEPSSSEIEDALRAKTALAKLWRHADFAKLDHLEQKSLSSFSMGNLGFVLSPEISNRVLSCLVDQTHIASLVGQASISAGSLKVPIDNADAGIDDSAWACEASCFANNPNSRLADGLGELEIKAESLRHVVCATSDLLQDASFNIENWIMQKVSVGFRNAISKAIMVGDGVGRPAGVLSRAAGVPICDTGDATPAGQFTWQDLVSLAFEVPAQWHPNAGFYMNQRTLGRALTMSDANGRPLLLPVPMIGDGGQRGGAFAIAGWPVRVATQLPDIAPGATPILFGDLRAGYLLVNRRATTMLPDPYSAGFCHLYKFEARVGGSVTCPNALRLLRIK